MGGDDLDRLRLGVRAEQACRGGLVQALIGAEMVKAWTQSLIAAWAAARKANGPQLSRSSLRRVRCQRSLPGRRGRVGLGQFRPEAVLRQTRSNRTFAGRGLVKRPVNCLPLSVSTSAGTPWTRIARTNASATALPGGRREHLGDDDGTGVVVYPGAHLSLVPIREVDPVDQVQLPQVHRGVALPTLVLAPVLLPLGTHEAVGKESAMLAIGGAVEDGDAGGFGDEGLDAGASDAGVTPGDQGRAPVPG